MDHIQIVSGKVNLYSTTTNNLQSMKAAIYNYVKNLKLSSLILTLFGIYEFIAVKCAGV